MRLSGESANLLFNSDVIYPVNTTSDLFFFNNILNLRVALGPMYNSYSKFCIFFNSIASFTTGANTTYTAGTITGITNPSSWLIGITGLDFINNSIDGVISKTALFPTTVSLARNGYANGVTDQIQTQNGIIQTAANPSGVTQTMVGVVFTKPSNDTQNITIQPYLVRGLQPGKIVTVGTNSFTNFSLSFTVYGLED
jgi:hypothetical protein